MTKQMKLEAAQLQKEWDSPRWQGITRDYSAEDVVRLRGSLKIEHTLALRRAEQIHWSEGKNGVDWFAPIVADAEAGFGGALNAYELMRAMIEAGAAGVHYEDQLASEKKCGHLGG